ncbi:MAG TPA: hypothetical protein VHN98_01300 [Acidimicrobiales bacterium]|nr:hypothetical protein [Acidimicrobiales bacterium]
MDGERGSDRGRWRSPVAAIGVLALVGVAGVGALVLGRGGAPSSSTTRRAVAVVVPTPWAGHDPIELPSAQNLPHYRPLPAGVEAASTAPPSCVVDSTGATWSCQYDAAQAGGYEATGHWSISIRRATGEVETRTYLDGSPACERPGFIRAGDEVTVIVRSPAPPATRIAAGPTAGASC